jgi:hypothetical protein
LLSEGFFCSFVPSLSVVAVQAEGCKDCRWGVRLFIAREVAARGFFLQPEETMCMLLAPDWRAYPFVTSLGIVNAFFTQFRVSLQLRLWVWGFFSFVSGSLWFEAQPL